MIHDQSTTNLTAPKPVLCVGITPAVQRTLRFERLQLGEVNRARLVTISAAGKATNVARVLKGLGGEPLLTGFIGGETGETIASFLRWIDVRTDFVTLGQPTRVCTTVMDEATGQVTELVEESPAPTDDEWTAFDEKLAALLPQAGMVVISGNLPPGAPDLVYASLAQKVSTLGLPLLVDATGEPLLNVLAYQPLLVKMNRRELAETCGVPVTDEAGLLAAARSLLDRGAQWVLITQGGQVCWLLRGEQCWALTPPPVQALNAVGSGDAVTAGIACGLRQGQSMVEATVLGLACGTANALTLTPGDVQSEDVERLRPQVRVTGP